MTLGRRNQRMVRMISCCMKTIKSGIRLDYFHLRKTFVFGSSKNSEMWLTFVFLAYLVAIFHSSTSDEVADPEVTSPDGLGEITWAFKKHSVDNKVPFFDGEEKFLVYKDMDFGPFGASKFSLGLGIQSTDAINSVKENLCIHFDQPNGDPAEVRFNGTEDSQEERILNFDITTPFRVHDVYIFIPSDVEFSNVKSVRFYTAYPTPDQSYQLISNASARALTVCSKGAGNACTYTFHGWQSQNFKFEKVSGGDYKIITSLDNKVFAVKDGSTINYTPIVVETFTNNPYQIWIIEEFDGGFRFRPKHNFSKCLDLAGSKNADGAVVVSYVCNHTPAQIWFIAKTN